jgi:hypothetical protein
MEGEASQGAANGSGRTMVLDAIETGSADFTPLRIGGPLLFGRLWERTGIRHRCSKTDVRLSIIRNKFLIYIVEIGEIEET